MFTQTWCLLSNYTAWRPLCAGPLLDSWVRLGAGLGWQRTNEKTSTKS